MKDIDAIVFDLEGKEESFIYPFGGFDYCRLNFDFYYTKAYL